MRTHEEQKAYEPDAQARKWAMWCHLSALLGWLIPLANIAMPMATWLGKRHAYALVESNGREAVNFQITVTIYAFALSGLLQLVRMIVRFPRALLLAPLGFPLIGGVVAIFAAVRARRGQSFRYPCTLRIV